MEISDIPTNVLRRVLHRRRKWLKTSHVVDLCAGVSPAKVAKEAGVHRQTVYVVKRQLGLTND